MNLERYQIEASLDLLDYEFTSNGPKGEIRKIVRFSKMEVADASLEIYNLAFGDYNVEQNKIDDLIVTDNKDSQRVLATVAAAIIAFTNEYPEKLIFIQGSTAVRMRYYRMGISSNLKGIEEIFEIWGFFDDQWELFKRNRIYDALLVKRK
ncbi:DUF6934 family protein [Chryseosolibacter indicus]|uniref:Uncharacterized protein n=1 Tax=Chryseosolibacter indicus TaxID=2782351 RepID=A0ABS5VJU9_9BACT|nr:hypothetical protein [Chryseosolibacter indicus]MBT1701715.1 hypothetical protein [Chryseosolibacter indicus]